MYRARNFQHEDGHAFFYALVLLPVILTLSLVVFDLSKWQASRTNLQEHADKIAVLAARSLPDVQQATAQIHAYIQQLPGITVASDEPFYISPNEIAFALASNSPSVFDFFLSQNTGKKTVLHSKQAVRVKIVPGDFVVILSDAASLRPRPFQTWDDISSYPPSNYFTQSLPPLPSTDPNIPSYSNDQWGNSSFQRWVTAQCFNSVFLPLKLAASVLIEELLSAQTNKVAALFSPGSAPAQSFEQIASLNYQHERDLQWLDSVPRSWISDETCVYLSDPLQDGTAYYALPENIAATADGNCSELLNNISYGHHFPSGKLTPCFRDSVSLAARVYYRAAQDREHDITGDHLLLAIYQALSELSRAESEESLLTESPRKNLRVVSQKQIIALVDTLPPTGSELEQLKSDLERAQVKLTIVYLPHQGLVTTTQYLSNTSLPITEESLQAHLDQRYQTIPTDLGANLQIYRIDSPEALLSTAVPRILEATRVISISE